MLDDFKDWGEGGASSPTSVVQCRRSDGGKKNEQYCTLLKEE